LKNFAGEIIEKFLYYKRNEIKMLNITLKDGANKLELYITNMERVTRDKNSGSIHKLQRKIIAANMAHGAVFTTLHFLQHLWTGPII
jgi:hypothetical protein